AEVSPQELLVALAELQNHVLGYVKSMSLKCAVDLGITDAIHRRGSTATLADIAADTKVRTRRGSPTSGASWSCSASRASSAPPPVLPAGDGEQGRPVQPRPERRHDRGQRALPRGHPSG
uniref:O-methyltransferase dimerisation domain-containing protein n=1 Tax=Aegilops tauschii subsp. strangulata TaxID=200361 RepID=A0A453J7P4_AEGTS